MEPNNTSLTLVKTPEAESETPTRIQPTNGVLKRHAPIHHHNHDHPTVVTYKECLRNFAASLGGHSLDGCGEFMSSTSSTSATNPLMCAVCGCHRNFHRRETEEFTRIPVLEFQSHNRHNTHQPQPQPQLLPPPQTYGGGASSGSPSNSPSPPPISSAYYPSAPQILMALSVASGQPGSDPVATNANAPNANLPSPVVNSANSRKRHRTKFTTDQKGKMVQFAEKLGWKMQKKDESEIKEFCSEIGVERGVFKVWMHNNKHTSAGKDLNAPANSVAGISTPPALANGNVGFGYQQLGNGERKQEGEMGLVRNPNGSSSTS